MESSSAEGAASYDEQTTRDYMCLDIWKEEYKKILTVYVREFKKYISFYSNGK
jgi:hypothetical protein